MQREGWEVLAKRTVRGARRVRKRTTTGWCKSLYMPTLQRLVAETPREQVAADCLVLPIVRSAARRATRRKPFIWCAAHAAQSEQIIPVTFTVSCGIEVVSYGISTGAAATALGLDCNKSSNWQQKLDCVRSAQSHSVCTVQAFCREQSSAETQQPERSSH